MPGGSPWEPTVLDGGEAVDRGEVVDGGEAVNCGEVIGCGRIDELKATAAGSARRTPTPWTYTSPDPCAADPYASDPYASVGREPPCPHRGTAGDMLTPTTPTETT
ncbi:hypothetical protein [Streptomyces sp. NPDC001530]|uniref:hypothetical protein n=1 Tax=Streptomyces sp. NPDC001530 TaxID=3364582 RepID=UPI0036B1CDD0